MKTEDAIVRRGLEEGIDHGHLHRSERPLKDPVGVGGLGDIACGTGGLPVGCDSKVLGEVQAVVDFLVDLVARHGVGIGDEDGGDMRLHSQCLAELIRGDSGFGDFISIESEH